MATLLHSHTISDSDSKIESRKRDRKREWDRKDISSKVLKFALSKMTGIDL